MPGGIVADLVLKPKEFSPPILILAANSLIYSAITYAGVSVLGRGLGAEKMRTAMIRLVLPVAVLVGLVCIPKLNPLWPRGVRELTAQQEALQGALPIGIELDRARAVLRSRGIQFYEETETAEKVVLDDGMGMRVTATPGDHVVSARLQTEARAFPCGYDIEVLLLFRPDQTMRQQYVHPLRICP